MTVHYTLEGDCFSTRYDGVVTFDDVNAGLDTVA